MHPPEPAVERPLNGFARTLLIGTSAATIALFYLFITASLLVLSAWIALIFVAVLALARFGVAGLITKYLERDIRLLLLLARSLWLRKGADFRLTLQPSDAPRLLAMVQTLAGRLGIPAPDELCLEMSCGAWVELRGLKTGIGTTRVGVGYDLLAALTEQEVEAVMAHELAHAKLIGRAFHNWLFSGLRRAATVSNNLSATADGYRRSNQSFGFGEWILFIADALIRLCARQMGAYSRQGEFEADQLAAQICGSAPMRSALHRLEAVQDKLGQLRWNERVAQIESPDGLSRWLLQELASVPPTTIAPSRPAAADKYSTHPSLHDRSAALTDDGSSLKASPSGLTLLENPDRIALQLVDVIEKTALQEERKDLRELKDWLGRIRKTGRYRPAQLPGMLVIAIGFVVSLVALLYSFWISAALIAGIFLPLGIWFYRLGYYRDKRRMPIPDFAVFMKAREKFPLPNLDALEKELETEIKLLIAQEQKTKAKAARLVAEAYLGLERCDYLRAHVASRLAVEFDKKSIERALSMLVAAAAFQQSDTVRALLNVSVEKTGLRSPGSAWAAAWALMLTRDWMPAEALLHETLKTQPGNLDLRAMLAFCQARRGKLQSAIENIRVTCQPRPPTIEHHKLLVTLLLDRGALREASEQIAAFGPASAYDPSIVQLRVRFHLLRRELTEAERQLTLLDLAQLPGHYLLGLGGLFENARAEIKATEFYQKTLTHGHFPEALLGLGRLSVKTQDKAQARQHVLAALDTTKVPHDKSASLGDVFHDALAQLFYLETPIDNSRCWIATCIADKNPLGNRSVVIFAPTAEDAENYLRNLVGAMHPATPPPVRAYFKIKAAPRDMQPNRSVHPGVQYIYQ